MRRLVSLLLASLAPLMVAVPAHAAEPCSGDPGSVQRLDLEVDGQRTYGLYVLPEGKPRGLVMLGHGFSFNVDAWRTHMQKMARRDGVIAVTMNYRGLRDLPKDKSGFERSRGYPVKAGGEDIVAAAQHFDRRCPGLPGISVLGVSMGANSTGLAIASKPKRADGRPLFDFWVAVEGAHNIIELYQGARALGPANEFAANAKADIEAEAGGPFEAVPDAYRVRSNVLRAPDIAAAGLKGVVLVHAFEDGLAPYNQATEMQRALAGAGVPVDLFSVGRRGSDEEDTTLSSYAGQKTGMAGHGAEHSQTHIVIQSGFDRLSAILTRGEPAPCGRSFQIDDRPSGVAPDPRVATGACRPAPLPAGAGGPGAAPPSSSAATGCGRVGMPKAARRRGRTVLSAAAARCRVRLAVWKVAPRSCRFVRADGRLSARRSCRRPVLLRVATAGRRYARTLPARVAPGRYRAAAYVAGRRVSRIARLRVR